MTKEEMDLKEFVTKINKEQLTIKDYNFYMIVNDEEYEIEPVYTTDGRLHEIELEEDYDDIFEEFDLIDIVNARYFIKRK